MRVSLQLSLLALSTGLGLASACVEPSTGAPCSVDADCGGGMLCDIHDGQGTCQEDHGHAEGHETDSESGHAEGHEGHESGEPSACADEDRDDEFSVGLSKSGAVMTATFVSADPAPPIKGDNSWVMTWTDAQGQPLDGLTIVATPMMPDHGHGTPIEVEVMATGTPGEYSFSPVNMFMTGLWEVSFDASGDAGQDSLTFGFCVE